MIILQNYAIRNRQNARQILNSLIVQCVIIFFKVLFLKSISLVSLSITPARAKQADLNKIVSSFAIIVVLMLLPPSVAGAAIINLPKNIDGWTIFSSSSDTRILYVSSSGDDATGFVYSPASQEVGSNPFNPTGTIKAFATFKAAYAKTREGYPDWILFKRGDTFSISDPEGINPRNGRSATEPSLIGAYGATGASPLLKTETTNEMALRIHRSSALWIAVAGLDFYAYTRNPDEVGFITPAGLQLGFYIYSGSTTAPYSGILVEGCKFRFFDDSMVTSLALPVDGLVLRRNVFSDSYAGPTQSHNQGLYLEKQDAILEENIFVHNGWLNPAGGALGPATIFNHNVYNSTPFGAVYDGNIFIQGSNMNNKFTMGNTASNTENILITNNLYVDGQQGVGFGNNYSGNTKPFENVIVKENIFTNLGRSKHLQKIAWGVDFGYDTVGASAYNNYFINQDNSSITDNFAFGVAGIHTSLSMHSNIISKFQFAKSLVIEDRGAQLSTGSTKTNVNFNSNIINIPENSGYFVYAQSTVSGVSFSGNKYYGDNLSSAYFRVNNSNLSTSQWTTLTGDNSTFGQHSFPDPTRSIETYMAAIGETGTVEAFMSKCKAQDRYNWDKRFMASSVNFWLKAGFETTTIGIKSPVGFQFVR